MSKIIVKQNRQNTKKDYLENLAKLYQAATGAKAIDLNSQLFISDLMCWINERNKTKNNYIEALKSLGLDKFPYLSAEVGLGPIDSIAEELNLDTVITPYANNFQGVKHVRKGSITLVNNNDKRKDISRLNILKNIRNFVMQNPYMLSDFCKLEMLYNKYGYSFLAGVYGKLTDKDMNEKIFTLDILKKQLTTDVESEYFWNKDEYFYMIKTRERKK